jgi:glucokinase
MAKSEVHPRKHAKGVTIGIDLGGTKLAAALVDSHGKVLRIVVRPTVPVDLVEQDPRALTAPTPAAVKRHIGYVVDAMAEAAIEVLGETPRSRLIGIGLASAGPMNIDQGTLHYPSNFKGWKHVPLVRLLSAAMAQRSLKTHLNFQNDAIAAALGEGWIGQAKDCRTYVMITVGTGIGTGVILNGRPAQSGGMGSEWGHLLVATPGLATNPESYKSREVEGIASGTGLVRRAQAQGLGFTSAHALAEAARAGDKRVIRLFDDAAEALAALLYSLSLGFHPEKFVVAGGMLATKDLFLKRTISLYQDWIQRKNPLFVAPIRISRLGNQAGAIGAARLPLL